MSAEQKCAFTAELGDMLVVGREGPPPARLLKAAAVIAQHLHPYFGACPWIAFRDKSKESCVLASLTVRDFLKEVGFPHAYAAPVATVMRATRAGQELHSLAIGHPEDTTAKLGHWPGHMVCLVPCKTGEEGWLIDTTLYPARRPAWEQLPGMLMTTYGRSGAPVLLGLEGLAQIGWDDPDSDYLFDTVWLNRPFLTSWRKGPDSAPSRRREVVRQLAKHMEDFR